MKAPNTRQSMRATITVPALHFKIKIYIVVALCNRNSRNLERSYRTNKVDCTELAKTTSQAMNTGCACRQETHDLALRRAALPRTSLRRRQLVLPPPLPGELGSIAWPSTVETRPHATQHHEYQTCKTEDDTPVPNIPEQRPCSILKDKPEKGIYR